MNYMSFLRWGTLSALFLVLLTPFVIADGGGSHGLYIPFANMFFPFITGKNFLFRIFIEIALVCYVLLALRDPKYRPRPSLILWSVLGLVVWMAIATIASVDPIKSFWSNFERMEGYVTLLHLFVWFVMTGAVLAAEGLWERFFNFSVTLSAIMGLDALMQLLGWVPISSQSGARVDTTFGNATYLAVYMLFNIFITLYLLSTRWQERRLSATTQALYGVALVLQFVALYHTETRGALLGVIGGLIVAAVWVALFARTPQLKFMRKVSLWGLGALVVMAGVFIAARNTSFVQQNSTLARVASISLNDPTVQSRLLYIWPTALKGISERPVLGWGQENFNFVFNAHYQPAMYAQEQWFDRAHNQFLDFGIAGGIPALILYVALFGLAAWALWRSVLPVPAQAALIGLLAGYAFNNMFVFDNVVSFFYFFAVLAFLHSLSRKELPGWFFLSRPMGERALAVVAPVVIIGIAAGGWAFNAPAMARASTMVGALSSQGSPDKNLALFKEALGGGVWPGNPIGHQEAVEQLAQFTAGSIYPSSVDPTLKQQYLAVAADGLQKLMAQRKNDARLELFLGTVLSTYGAYEQALQYLKQALSHSPRKQQILMQVGLVQLQAGQNIDAIATLRDAFQEAPGYDVARIYYAASYYYTGDIKAGDKIIMDKWGTLAVDKDQLLTVYTNTKQYDRAAAIWQVRIDKTPQDAQAYLGLASIYFTAGDKQKTIATLRKASQVQPALAAQLENLITQIENGTLAPQ